MQLTTAQERAYDQAIAMIHDRAECIAESRHFAEAVRERGYRTEQILSPGGRQREREPSPHAIHG